MLKFLTSKRSSSITMKFKRTSPGRDSHFQKDISHRRGLPAMEGFSSGWKHMDNDWKICMSMKWRSIYEKYFSYFECLFGSLKCLGAVQTGFTGLCFWQEGQLRWVVPRLWRNRTGRPLSPSQIHQRIILMWSNFCKTTLECWCRTQDSRNAAQSLQKEVDKI